ncbi:lysocardiolipin acyltransferase 1-like isoform X3 [Cimex lectularius]|nr:lysocardiolipin acyltransferase 1-like isoform X3 [Cimex lectularius]XP_014249737.1 lysocardiolipin acyltransferase 1-like isoform X3 [Cimex lectularius]XP_014249746.1 lysocardiolipin acyltransferase 1-like isoform X3 [Cimex lectularius]
MKGSRWRGIVYCFLWYFSILSGFLILCCPLLPLMFFNQKAYRQAMELIFATWELYPVALMEILFGTEFVINGDAILPWDRSVLVMNHRTRLDWNFLWAALHYGTVIPAHRLKFVLKSPIRHAPGPGWVMQMAGFFFIHRKWETDQKLLSSMIEYLQELEHTYQILIFPEGTNLTENSTQRSNEYADKYHLPHYKQVLHPKTTGFTYLVQKMSSVNQLDAVYDLSVAYPGTLPETEFDVLRGYFPEQVHFNIRRYPIDQLPVDDEELKHWLSNIWKDKEDTLIQFYESGKFDSYRKINLWPRPLSNSLHLSVFFWSAIIFGTFSAFLLSTWFQIYTVGVCCLFILLSFLGEGMYHIEIAWFKLKHFQYVRNKTK